MRAGGDGRAHGLLGRSSSWLSRGLAARSSPRSSRTRGREASSHALGTRGAETGSQNNKKRLPCAILKKGKVNLFEQSRNPIIYGGAVEWIDVEDAAGNSDALAPGKPVYFSDWKSRIIGWGFYNPTSMYRCRVMELASDSPDGSFASGDGDPLSSDRVASFLRRRILQAREARKAIGLPSAHKTNAYRLINSEGDSLSGLVVDRFGTDLVVQSSSAWVESHKDVVLAALAESAGDDPEEEDGAAETIAWRSDAGILKKEGVEVESGFELYKIERNGDGAAPTVAPAPEAGGPESIESLVLENGARFAVRLDMQKTGFYCDQRANRAHVRSLSRGKRCLDLCCYTGGFAVSAALGGATSVTGVDSSAAAIEVARRNAVLNDVECDFVAEDISKFMAKAADRGDKWDVVVLDPPKLCPSAKFLRQALRKYERLNAMAMDLVSPGGILVTCSCSGAVAKGMKFLPMLSSAAARAGRDLRVLRTAGASEDHMTSLSYPEGQYLTVVTLLVV